MAENEAFESRLQEALAGGGVPAVDDARDVRAARLEILSEMLRQTGHRVGSVGLLALAGAIVIVVANNLSRLGMIGPTIDIKPSAYTGLLMAAFLACDVAIIASVAAWWLDPAWQRTQGETTGLFIFNVVTMLFSLVFFVMSRSEALNRMVSSILKVFE